MTDVLKMSRKALTLGVVLTTLLWSVMASVLVAPLQASAAGCTSGSLIKGSLAAVYYCGADGKRYVFTNDKAYFTWYPDFSGVMTISDADLASIQIGGNVTYRPGVKMLKIQSDPKVYAVAHGGVLRHVTSEAIAVCLYGSTWNQQIHDVSDAFFTNYSVGAAINACADYNKTAEMSSSQTINQDKNLATGGTSGTASVSYASDSPAGAPIPLGATGVNVLKFNVINSGGSAVVVDSITLRRVGPGNTTDISSVYLYEGMTRLTTGRSVNSSTNEANFTGLNLSLAAGQTRTLWVAIDVSAGATAGNVHAFSVSKAMTGSTLLSGTPFTGSNFTLTGATVGLLTIAKTGTITSPKLGEPEAKIAEFTIGAGSSEDVRLKRLTLYQGGNLAGANLTELKLKQAGLTIATATGFDANLRAAFTMSEPGLLLEKGATKTFQLYGKVGGNAREGDTIKIYTEEASDVYGVGQTYGYGTRVTRTAYDGDTCVSTADSTGCSYSTVDAGELTINFLGPASKDIQADNADNVEVFRFSMLAQSNIEVRNLRLQITSNDLIDGDTNYSDIKVTNVANGALWWGPQDASTDTGSDNTEALVFNEVQTLQAGTLYTFSVTLDTETGTADDDTVRIDLNAFGTSDLRNTTNGTFLTPSSDVVPGGAITGNTMTLGASALVTSLSSTPVSQTYIKGSTNVDFTGINLKAGDTNPVTVTSVTATGYIDADGTGGTMIQGFDDNTDDAAVRDVITQCRLMDGATVLSTKSPTSSSTEGTGGLLEFTGLNLVIPTSATKTLKINCDISNSAFDGGDADMVGFSIQTATDVVAQDVDGNAVTPTGTANATAATTRVTIQNTGTMTFAAAGTDSESEAGLVVASTPTALNTPDTAPQVVLGKFKLTAASESLKLTKVRASLLNANQSSVVSMSLFDGATKIAGPVTLSATNADFSGFEFVVPKDSNKTLTVKGVLNSIAAGAVSGADLQIELDTSSADGQANFEYRGVSSSTVVTAQSTGTDAQGETKILRKTKPTISDGPLATQLFNGTMTLARVNVSADAAGDVSLKSIIWSIGRSDGAVTFTGVGSGVREGGQSSVIAGSFANGCTGAATNTSCTFQSVFTSEQIIPAGTQKVYELELTVANAGTDDSISVNIASDSTQVTGELAALNGIGGDSIDDLDGSNATTAIQNLIWSDNSVVLHDPTVGGTPDGDDAVPSNDWTNGRFVKFLPTPSRALRF